MKKVSVFTVLTCFLAGGVSLPCYAGNPFSKLFNGDEDDASKAAVSSKSSSKPEVKKDPADPAHPPSLPVEQKSGQDASSHPKTTPSPSPFDPVVVDSEKSRALGSNDLDPDLLAKTPATFDPSSDLKDDPRVLQQIADGVRGALGPDAQNVVINVYMNPSPSSLGQHPSSLPPSILPDPLPERVLDPSRELPSADRSSPPAQGASQIPSMHPTPYPPYGELQPPLSIPPSLRDHEEVREVTPPVSGWSLTLPTTLKPIQIPNTRGQLVRLPKVLDLCIYAALSDVTHPDFKAINSQKALEDSQKPAGFNLINTYLKSYGSKFAQDTTAIANCLKQGIESSNGRPVSFKVCQNKETRTALFMLHVEGGAVIIGKVPGQDF